MSVLATQVGALARRSVTRTASQPASAIPPLVFPLALLAVNSGGLQASTELPGFPSTSFLAFALAVPFIQGALFSTMNAGTDLARDIQTGFFTRLSLTPMRGSALLTGQLTGIVRAGRPPGGRLHRRRPARRRPLRVGPARDRWCCSCSPRSCRSASALSARFSRCAPAPASRSRVSSRCSSCSCSSRR